MTEEYSNKLAGLIRDGTVVVNGPRPQFSVPDSERDKLIAIREVVAVGWIRRGSGLWVKKNG